MCKTKEFKMISKAKLLQTFTYLEGFPSYIHDNMPFVFTPEVLLKL
jgi:hypothetical protein